MYSLDDTIAAISTPVGEGGIGIVRLSGPDALAILRNIFLRGRKRSAIRNLQPYRLTYGHIVDPDTAQPLDEVLVAYMPAPWTYTRQDVVEINCHGGIVPLRKVLELCLRYGARLASPGEFTLRAFLNGRIDLAQAEAVLDIVRAKTAASLRVAVGQLDGRLSNAIRQVRAQMVDVLSWLEASVDFAEDEIPSRDITPDLEEVQERLERLLATADQGIVYRQGVRTAIVGRPNVGKSSLLNALLRTSRAIVTSIPGTTRDTLEETLNLQGVPLVLALAQADLALLVVDGSEPLTPADHDIAALLEDKPGLLVINKCDLPVVIDVDGFLPNLPRVRISALTGEGLDTLESAIVESVFSGQVLASDALLVSNPRHKDALQRAYDHVLAARQTHAHGLPADFVAIDLTAAINALGEITGETLHEDLLETIFSNFCIGK